MKYLLFCLAIILASPSALPIGDSAGGCAERTDLVTEIQTTNGDLPKLLFDIERRLNLERSNLSSWMKSKLAKNPSLAIAWERETRSRLLSEPIPCSSQTPLDIALRYANRPAVKAILSAGSDPEGAFIKHLNREYKYTAFGERCIKPGASPSTSLTYSQKEIWQLLVDAAEAAGRHSFGADVQKCRDPLLREYLVSIGAGRKRPPPPRFSVDAYALYEFPKWVDAKYGPGTEHEGEIRRANFQDVARWSAAAEKKPKLFRRLPSLFPNLDNAWTVHVGLPDNINMPAAIILFTANTQTAYADAVRQRSPDASFFILDLQEFNPIGARCIGPACQSSWKDLLEFP